MTTTKLTAETHRNEDGTVTVTIYDKAHTAREAYNMTRCYWTRGAGRVKLVATANNYDDHNVTKMIETRTYRQG